VVTSKAPHLVKGDHRVGDTGWQDYAAVPAKDLSKDAKLEPMTHLLSVYGIAGLTAYFGLPPCRSRSPADRRGLCRRRLGRFDRRQIAKIRGCHVVGIAGGKDKCHWLTSELGFEPRSITRTAPPTRRCGRRRQRASTSISTMSAATSGSLPALMNNRGRIACCGGSRNTDGVPSATVRAVSPVSSS